MRITIDGAQFARAISWVAKFTDVRSINTAGVILSAGQHITAAASDYELFGTVAFDGDVEQSGTATIPGRALANIAALLPRGDHVRLDVSDGVVTIRRGRTTWTLPEISPDYAPRFPDRGRVLGTVDGDALRRALKVVLPSVGKDVPGDRVDIPQVGNVEATLGEVITLAATDRQRISSVELDWVPTGSPATLVIPGATLAAAEPILAGTVTLAASDACVTVDTGTHQFTSRLAASAFLPWRNAVPRQCTTTVTVEAAQLMAAIKEAAVFAKKPGDYLELSFMAERITVSLRNHEDEQASCASIDPVSFDGPEKTLLCQPQYLIDALKTAPEFVTLHLGPHPKSPMLIRGQRYQHVITVRRDAKVAA